MNQSQDKLPRIAVIIPCYRVKPFLRDLCGKIPDFVWKIYCVDDFCPDRSTEEVQETERLRILKHTHNQGVGGAVLTGFAQALKEGAEILVKLDGDGQMDPALISRFVKPILAGQCDYTKGNRFYRLEDVRAMPIIRLLGNAALSFLTKLSSGYWSIFDPTNGYVAVHASVLKLIPLDKINRRYFFESDLLFRLGTVRAAIMDIPMTAVYGEEQSSLRIGKILWPFLKGHSVNLAKRIFYNYFLRDFNFASVTLVLGAPMMLFGIGFGLSEWRSAIDSGMTASAGTVMLSALPVIVGMQLVLSFLQYDIQSTPRQPLHPLLLDQDEGI